MVRRIIAVLLLLSLACIGNICAFAAEDDAAEVVLISDAEGLASIASAPDKSYRLISDIDMSGIQWNPPVLTGEFDGNGYTIYNLTVTQTGDAVKKTYDGNKKEYETVFAALFSAAEKAKITNVTIKGMLVDIHAQEGQNCFAALLAGYIADTEITNCDISGRVYLHSTGKMVGVGGAAGFGWGTIDGCKIDAELVFVDENTTEKCEEFLGAVVSCGYPNIYNCTVKMTGYASVSGYVHNGGMIGMHFIHRTTPKRTCIKDSTIDAYITFFEDNKDRRAYCGEYVGELLGKKVRINDCTVVNYNENEVFEYDRNLYPEMCAQPSYTSEVIDCTCDTAGYTKYTCDGCGYSFVDSYTLPNHTIGEWETVIEPTVETDGLMEQRCVMCEELLGAESIPKLIAIESCVLDETAVKLNYKDTMQIGYTTYPENADVIDLIFTSSDDTVINVDNSGMMTAVGKGTATVYCTTPDGTISESIDVKVGYSFWQWAVAVNIILLAVVSVALVTKYVSSSRRKKNVHK